MARLDSFPSLKIIQGFKGVVDYACWKGQPYARRWPRKPTQPRVAAVKAQYPAFGYIVQQYQTTDASVNAALQAEADGTKRTARDYQIVNFYGYDVTFNGQ